jgi:AcrR family transcriptional regulator
MSPTSERKTALQRRTETRTRLIEATLTCLEKWGYHGSSLNRILERAGVSRGTFNRYFATKDELVAAAAEYALNRIISITRTLGRNLPVDQLDFGRLFDFIWDNFYTGRQQAVGLEFYIACRTETTLRQRLSPVLEEFHEEIERVWEEYFTAAAHTTIPAAAVIMLTINTLRGMAIHSVVQDDPAYFKKLRSYWISIMDSLIQRRE